MLAGVLALAICTGCAVGAALAWSGRWRSWRGTFFGAYPITLLPGAAAGSLAAGLGTLGVISSSSPLSMACFAVMVVCFLMAFATPRWWGPRWYRERDRSADLDVATADPLSALVVVGLSAVVPGDERLARSRARTALGPAIETWKGSWIAGDETEPAAHGLTHAGAVEGRLQLHPDAVTFVASRVEDLLSDLPTVLTIDAGELRDVRVVPRGAGADGRPTEGRGPRSLFARLVLDSDDGSYLFEVQHARRTARRIGEALGVGAVT